MFASSSLRTARCSLSSASNASHRLSLPCSTKAPLQVRTVATLNPSIVFPHRTKARVYDDRKTYLYNQYTRIFRESTEGDQPALFFSHADFNVGRLLKLRTEINNAALKFATPPPSLAGAAPAPMKMPQFTILRTSIFGVALRDYTPLDRAAAHDLVSMIDAQLAVLTLPSLNPPQMQAIIRAIARNVPPRIPKTQEQLDAEKKAADAAFVPGRRPKRQRPIAIPELKLLGALVEGRLFKAKEVENVASLPTLDVLRAQVVGLLSAPSAQLAAVLSQASGGKLARTLEGLKKSLEDSETPPPNAP